MTVHEMKRGNEDGAAIYYRQLVSDRPLWLIDMVLLQNLQHEERQRQAAPGGLPHEGPPEIDSWVSSGKAGKDRFRDPLERLLMKKIKEVDQLFELKAEQRQKLRLAGHGDIKRILEAVEDSRRNFDLTKKDADLPVPQRQDLRTLELLVNSGPFEFGSLFHKTLRKMFVEQQLKRRPAGAKKFPVGA